MLCALNWLPNKGMGHDDLCSLSLIIALMTESHFALADKITNYVDVETFPGGKRALVTRTGSAGLLSQEGSEIT